MKNFSIIYRIKNLPATQKMKSKGQGTNGAASQLGRVFRPLEGIFGLVLFWFGFGFRIKEEERLPL